MGMEKRDNELLENRIRRERSFRVNKRKKARRGSIETPDEAALVLQAAFRGHLRRKGASPTTSPRILSVGRGGGASAVQALQVTKWLESVELQQYSDLLLAEGFDRLSTCAYITDEDLAELKVKRGHRRLLLAAAAQLRA